MGKANHADAFATGCMRTAMDHGQSSRKRRLPAIALACLFAAYAPSTLAKSLPAPESETAPAKMNVEADQLVYDKDRGVVSAVGGVVIYYKGNSLQADKVTYDRGKHRLDAEGRVKLTDPKGNAVYGAHMDMTDDFAAGFADSVHMLGANRTRMTSPRIERSSGSLTVLSSAAYTACEPCKANLERPPEWQIKAAKVIENQETHTVYFEDAWFSLYGVPIAYLPFFSTPDGSVPRKSGILTPIYHAGSNVGFGAGIPYYFALAPNYDLTLTPIWYSAQGPFGEAAWRHRIENGEYSVRLDGIDQQTPHRFALGPYGAGNLSWRGSVATQGRFSINQNWKFGWDLTWQSDRFFNSDYSVAQPEVAGHVFGDLVSSAYLRGQGAHSYFDLSAYGFQANTAYIDQRQLPIAAPVVDYDRTFTVDPTRTFGIGGEFKIETNAANVNRAEAAFRSVGTETFDKAYALYDVCASYAPGKCIVNGAAGDYARTTIAASWQRRYVDPIGEVWTPMAFVRANGLSSSLSSSGDYTYSSLAGSSTISNASQGDFFGSGGSTTTGMAGVGLEYRYPFASHSSFGDQTVQPIVQALVRPDEALPRFQPNEDARSLVFDDTNLFAWNKFSGYDRMEGGTRINYGLQYATSFANGGHADAVVGQSMQAAGRNSYTIGNPYNTGLESGLDKRMSNYVAGETVSPFRFPVSIGSKQQFDSATGSLNRLDAVVSSEFGGLKTSLDYGRYAAQPMLGYTFAREGLFANASYKLSDMWKFDGSVVFDMSRHSYALPGSSVATERFFPSDYKLGFAYTDTCTTFRVLYSSVMGQPLAYPVNPLTAVPTSRNQTLMFELTLRTLGEVAKATSTVN